MGKEMKRCISFSFPLRPEDTECHVGQMWCPSYKHSFYERKCSVSLLQTNRYIPRFASNGQNPPLLEQDYTRNNFRVFFKLTEWKKKLSQFTSWDTTKNICKIFVASVLYHLLSEITGSQVKIVTDGKNFITWENLRWSHQNSRIEKENVTPWSL